MGKGDFRFEDPFLKDRDLIYKHIGFTKAITWRYQDVLLGSVVFLILVLQSERLVKGRFKCPRSLQRWLLTDSLIWNSYFQCNMNLVIIVTLYAANIGVAFINLPMNDSFNLALRFGLVAMSNIPLLYLLPLKASVFSLSLSYENLVIYHKAVGVLVLVTSLIHAGAFVYCLSWPYLLSDLKALTGWYMIGSFCLLGLASLFVVRRYIYELFYSIHVLASYTFLPICYRHHYVCKPFVILVTVSLIIDKLVKLSKTYSTTCTVRSSPENPNDLIIVIEKPLNFSWRCSNHIYINIPRISLYQTHPFTIANLPDDGSSEILIIIKINHGFTQRLYQRSLEQKEFSCFIHGAYGVTHTHIHLEDTNHHRYSITQESQIVEAPITAVDELSSLNLKDAKTQGFSYGSVSSSLDSIDLSHRGINDLLVSYMLVSAGSGITFILPILLKLLKYEKDNNLKLNFKFLWIVRDDTIMKLLPIEITQILSRQSDEERVELWYTSKQGRPNLNDTLYRMSNSDQMARTRHLKVFACGPEALVSGVKDFGIEKGSTDSEVDLILEKFSF